MDQNFQNCERCFYSHKYTVKNVSISSVATFPKANEIILVSAKNLEWLVYYATCKRNFYKIATGRNCKENGKPSLFYSFFIWTCNENLKTTFRRFMSVVRYPENFIQVGQNCPRDMNG